MSSESHSTPTGGHFIPKYGLKFKFDKKFPNKHTQNLKPSLKQIIDILPMMIRYIPHYLFSPKPVMMDYIKMQNSKCIYGAPLGGIGGGSIGRGFAGEFCRYALNKSIYEYEIVHQNQFILNIKNEKNETIFQSLLSTYSRPKGVNSAWKSNLDASKCNYTALYPRSWSEYSLDEYGIKLICRQISPFIPHNYKDSSLPSAVFVWEIENFSDEVRQVSITFVMKNGTGNKNDSNGKPESDVFETNSVEGAKICQTIGDMPCDYYIGTSKTEGNLISKVSKIDPKSDGSKMWNDLNENGILTEKSEEKNLKTGKDVCVAVSNQVKLNPKKSSKIEFSFVWDSPKIKFSNSTRTHTRYYTKYFKSGLDMIEYSVKNYPEWENKIADWQKEVLEDEKLPDWFKGAVFNELYFIADGGSLWLLVGEDEKLENQDPRRTYGRFLYLEGHEYRMYNTYDVHFYASAALISLFPNLEICLQYDFRDCILSENTERRKMLYDGKTCIRKVKNSTPHDLGEPVNDPVTVVNAYPIHDVAEWKDLNPKFILQIYRDYKALIDLENSRDGGNMINEINARKFIMDFYPVLQTITDKTIEFDKDGDGLIENDNAPDQTYDTWTMSSASSYCSGLFLTALKAMSEISKDLKDEKSSLKYLEIFEKGKISMQEKLWNGSYYLFDLSGTKTIMSDQLCGHWYAKLCGLDYEIFPEENVKSALKIIFDNNVKSFCNGEKGAVNGFIPGEGVDHTSMQSEEIWVGVNYALASTMIFENMTTEAFEFTEELYKNLTEKIGLAFETPEALYEANIYRSIGYMRCLSIWSMLTAFQKISLKN